MPQFYFEGIALRGETTNAKRQAVQVPRAGADGRQVEHWDVLETISPSNQWKNPNGKF
jgi:hypothetical protein